MVRPGSIRTYVAGCLAALLASIAVGGAPVPAIRPMYFEHLTPRDGLSMSTVNAILQDSAGYMWFATESGLDRYDGYTVHEYRRQRGKGHGLASDYIWAMAEDAHTDLWLATNGGGLARWERSTDRFTHFTHDAQQPHSLASNAVRSLLIDSSGKVWAGTMDQGLDVLDPATGEARHFRHHEGDPNSLSSDAVGLLYSDSKGRIWVGTDAGFGRFEPAIDSFQNLGPRLARAGLTDLHVRAIREDRAGRLYIGTVSGGLAEIDPDGRVEVFRHDAKNPASLSHDRVTALLEDADERLWVATADGLDLFDPVTRRFSRYGHDVDNPQSLRDSDIMSLYQDRGGVLWVGTRGGGASHWNPRSWLLGHYLSAPFRATAGQCFCR